MTEIVIFDIPEQDLLISKSQKQLQYEELGKHANIDTNYIEILIEIDESYYDKPTGNLPSILLKYLIQYCTPIITNDNNIYSITLQTEYPILTILDNNKINIPSNTQFKIIGIEIPYIFLKIYNRSALVYYDHVSDDVIGLSGRFSLIDQQTDQFTQQRKSFTHPGLPNIDENIIHFKSDENTLDICKKLINYIEYIEIYYIQ